MSSPARSPSPDLHRLLDRFEEAWQRGSPAALDHFLTQAPSHPPDFRQFILELVKIDLEYRWRKGEAPKLEEYCRRFPRLGAPAQLPAALIGHEYCIRHCHGDRPGHAEFLTRFRTASGLSVLLHRIDKELDMERLRHHPAPGATAAVPTAVTVAAMLDALGGSRILTAAQLVQLKNECAKNSFPEPRALARRLMELDWLTPYQVNQFLLGRSAELLLGSYVLQERLGDGGKGQVYKARHQNMNRVVALKVIRRELLADPETVRRFYQEIEALSKLSHPNVVHAFDAGPAGAMHFLAMEYVEGMDLGRKLKEAGPLPIDLVCDCIRQAAVGLQHAHEHGLVHRDVKPSNLLVSGRTPNGKDSSVVTAPLVKLLDLGLARLRQPADPNAFSTLTQEGTLMGTPDYLAPEQATNAHTVDIRADLYSLGCTFYQLLTGQPPFPGGTLIQKIDRHRWEAPQPVEKLRPETPPAVAAVVMRLLAKRPEDRYATPAEVAAVLAMTNSGSSTGRIVGRHAATVPDFMAKVPVPRRRHVIVAGLFCLLFLLLGGAWLLRAKQGPPEGVGSGSKDGLAPPAFINSANMEMVLIKSGTFERGSPATEIGHRDDEGPTHLTTLSRAFYIDKREASVAAFRKFVEATGHQTEAEKENSGSWCMNTVRQWRRYPGTTWKTPNFQQADNQPVVCVSWNDVTAYCRWLSEQEGRLYRLPTEAEWEFTCRAGTTTPFNLGALLKVDAGNFDGRVRYGDQPTGGYGHDRTLKGDNFSPNEWGIYDVHGNAGEWCSDWYEEQYYKNCPRFDPAGAPGGTERVWRGGSWFRPAADCRSAARFKAAPDYRATDLGFRVVCEVGKAR